MSSDTLPGLLVERAAATPNAVALRFFRQGKWNDVTLGQLQEKAAAIGSGLSARGVKSGETVAVIAEDGPLCLAAELGAQGIGAVVLALDPDLLSSDVVTKLKAAAAVAVIAGDQEQFDKVEESRNDLPALRLLVVDATRGLRELERLDRDDCDRTLTVAQLCAGVSPTAWMSGATSLKGNSAARTSSGTSTTHESVLGQAGAFASRLSLSKSDALCSLQPIANGTEHALAVAGPLLSGSILHFRGRATPQQAMRQVQPTVVYSNPLWLARLSAETDAQVARATGLKKFALDHGLRARQVDNKIGIKPRPNALRAGGLAAFALAALMLAATSASNETMTWHLTSKVKIGSDVIRVFLVMAIVVAVVGALLAAGYGAIGPIRRRYGLSRCRAVLSSEGTSIPGADLLGALHIPLIDLTQEATS
jgi:long-chain acyl-CoA synthetase